MQFPNDGLSLEAHEAIIACLRIAARRGKQLRQERELARQIQIQYDLQTDELAVPEVSSETESNALPTLG